MFHSRNETQIELKEFNVDCQQKMCLNLNIPSSNFYAIHQERQFRAHMLNVRSFLWLPATHLSQVTNIKIINCKCTQKPYVLK